MNEFDDPQLASMLGRLSGGFPDVNVAHQAVHGRVRQARRRRAVVASTAAGFVLLGGAAVVAQGVSPHGRFTPAHGGSSSAQEATTTIDDPTTEVEETASSTTETGATTVPTVTITVTVPAGQGGTPGTTGSTGTSSGSSSGSSSSSSTPRTTVAVVKDTDTTLTSDGGSIVYHWDGTTLTLVEVAPTDGWTSHVMDETATRLRVEFANGSETWRVEVRTDGSGKQPVEITLHG